MDKKNEIMEYYDLTAEETANEWYHNPMLLPTIQEFLGHLPPNPRILDLGCGTGHESLRMIQEGATVMGVDFSRRCIRIARARCPNGRFKVVDFYDLDERYGMFDGVFAAGSLIHLSNNSLLPILNRVRKILKAAGKLLAIMVAGEGIDEKRSNLMVNERLLRRTLYRYLPKNLIAQARKSGFIYVRDLHLDKILQDYGWYASLFQLHPLTIEPRFEK